MQRFYTVLFAFSVIVGSWLLMQATHELGHIVGACLTGGSIEKVVLKPLAISRTDVSPNPHPAIVVWAGPLIGCLLPWLLWRLLAKKWTLPNNVASFFAGFCLIANGAYISIGSFEGIGDCGEMLRTGTPQWTMIAFGIATISLGLYVWHRLGRPLNYLAPHNGVSPLASLSAFAILVFIVVIEMTLGAV